jgi:hypothetical protein
VNHPDGRMDSDVNHIPRDILPLLPVVNEGVVSFAPGGVIVVGAHVILGLQIYKSLPFEGAGLDWRGG